MSSKLNSTNDKLRRLLEALLAFDSDWTEPGFCAHKAYICSLVSQIAYEHIPPYELTTTDRASIVPCEGYQANVQIALNPGNLVSWIVEHLGPEGEFPPMMVLRSPLAIAFVIRTRNVTFVSLRGTQLAFTWFGLPHALRRATDDLKADLDFRKVSYRDQYRYQFDKGFYEACDSIYEMVKNDKAPDDHPVYLTGHSLGGAMAAIMFARWCDDLEVAATSLHSLSQGGVWIKPISCYTFGMPRYANAAVIRDFALPWHIYNTGDTIPTVPAREAGYADLPSTRERCLDPSNGTITEPARIKDDTKHDLREVVHFFRGTKNHMMEKYISGLELHLKSKDQKFYYDGSTLEIDGVKLPVNKRNC